MFRAQRKPVLSSQRRVQRERRLWTCGLQNSLGPQALLRAVRAIATLASTPLRATCRGPRETVTSGGWPRPARWPFPKVPAHLPQPFWPKLGHMPTLDQSLGRAFGLDKLRGPYSRARSISQEKHGRKLGFLDKFGIILVGGRGRDYGWVNSTHSLGRKQRQAPTLFQMNKSQQVWVV